MEQPDLLRSVVDALEELGVPYAVVGSVASSAYGEARHTLDVWEAILRRRNLE